LLTVLWVVGITNAINLMDGMDSLAGGQLYHHEPFSGFGRFEARAATTLPR